jgi:hypothetical protein
MLASRAACSSSRDVPRLRPQIQGQRSSAHGHLSLCQSGLLACSLRPRHGCHRQQPHACRDPCFPRHRPGVGLAFCGGFAAASTAAPLCLFVPVFIAPSRLRMHSLSWAVPRTPCRCVRPPRTLFAPFSCLVPRTLSSHVLCRITLPLQDSAIEHARSLGMADDLIVRAMICACFKHPLHSTAILRRTCLGCSCASRVVTECFDSACCCLPSNVRQFTPFAVQT